MKKREITFGVIGCGLMGQEFASAAARWCHLNEVSFRPVVKAACDLNPVALSWFSDNVPGISVTSDYQALLNDDGLDAVYCAVPHNLHSTLYIEILASGKHLLGEKPFGIDKAANQAIMSAVHRYDSTLACCSSEFPFYPGAYRLAQWVRENRFGQIIDVEAGFWHSSDLNPEKKVNWKRLVKTNGEYGCMGDLGMHVVHLPLRFGWMPQRIQASLSNIISERPNENGERVACDTWDNAHLSCQVETAAESFPLLLSTKRIAPGHANTWFIKINGTERSAVYTTKYPKRLKWLPYTSGAEQAWHSIDVPYKTAYDTITGGIFEFGFSDAILQMWAAFCDELVHGRNGMQQPMYCVTPAETAQSHAIFTAALQSQEQAQMVALKP